MDVQESLIQLSNTVFGEWRHTREPLYQAIRLDLRSRWIAEVDDALLRNDLFLV